MISNYILSLLILKKSVFGHNGGRNFIDDI